MDGVLINSEPFHFKVWKETLKRRGVDLDYSVYKNSIGSTDGFLMQLLYENYGIDPWDTSLMTEMEALKEELMEKEGFPLLIPYVKELLEKLSKGGYQMAVASSSPQEYIEKITSYWGIQKYFNKLVSGESVAHPKPAPDVFFKAAGELGLSPGECMVIEDSENGCKAGLVFNPATPLSYLDYVMDKLDVILLMSVNPGFGGQSFIPQTLDKLREVRRRIDESGFDIRLEVDGGVKVNNIGEIAAAGADMFVAGSAIFDQPDYKKVIDEMRSELAKVSHE